MKFKEKVNQFWPILIIILTVLIFFWPFFLKGLVPMPADIVTGMYYPWLDYKWGYAVGVPVKNPPLSDVVSQIYPYKIHALRVLKSGLVPFWNPLMFGGFPHLANIQVGLFNLTNLFFLILPPVVAWSWQVAFQPLLAALFGYLFFRSLNLSKAAAILGGVVFAFSGFMVIWLEWNVHGFAVAFLPILLYLTQQYFRSGQAFWGALLSLALAGQIFAGYPPVVIFSALALIIFVASQFPFWQKRTVFWFFWLGMGVALASIQLFPTLELFLNSQRRGEVLTVAESFLPWPHLVSLWAPDFFGNPTTGNYWGPGDYTHSALYSGLAVLILSFLAWKRIRQRKEVLFFTLLLLISLALVLPTSLATIWRPGEILGQGAIAMTRILFLVNFALAGLAACGFDFLVKGKNTVKGLLWTAVPILGLVIIFGKTLGEYQGWLPREAGISLINLRVGMRNLFLPALVTFGTIVLLFLTILGGKSVRRAALGLIFLLTVGELFRFGWKYTPFVPSNLVFPETPVIRFLKSQPGIFRVEGGDVVPMNMFAAYGLSSFSAYDPMYPLRQAQFLTLIDSGSLDSSKSRYGQISHYDSPLFDLANICYILAVKRDNLERPDPQGNSMNWRFKLPKFKSVFEDRSVMVLENSNCLPRAFLARHYLVERTDKQIVERLQAKEFAPGRTVILEKDPGVVLAGEIGAEETVEQTVFGPNRQEFLVMVKKPALLLVSESDYPGWEAEIDGRKTEIFRADFAFRSVLVPAGEHKVSFEYRPASFRTGLLVSGASLLFLLLAILRRLL
jgi:hypothetical protein